MPKKKVPKEKKCPYCEQPMKKYEVYRCEKKARAPNCGEGICFPASIFTVHKKS